MPLDPYLLGLTLGDGCITQSRHNQLYFTSSIEDLDSYKKYLPYKIKTHDDRHHRILISKIGNIFKQLRLSEAKSRTKFIPDVYKYNDYNTRLDVLQGLMDTDGTIGYGGNPQFCTTSEKLCYDVMELARSLGINCNLNRLKNKFGNIYNIRFYTSIKLFRLERKASKQKITKTRSFRTAIVDIKKYGKMPSKCVTVDSEDGCYLIGDFILTHNSKGTNSGKMINAWGRRLQRDWLLTPAINKNFDKEGDVVDHTLNLHRIRSLAYLEELIKWNIDGNFDRVSAMGMCMILKADRTKFLEAYKNEDYTNGSELAQDSYFKVNYDDKFDGFSIKFVF